MTFTTTILTLATEAGVESLGPPVNKWPDYGMIDTIILPDILAFFGIVATGVIALLLMFRRPKALSAAHYLIGAALAVAMGTAVAVYFINRPSRFVGTGSEFEGAFEIAGPPQEAPHNLHGCYDCPPSVEASFVDLYMETVVIIVPLALISILGINWIAVRLREWKQKT